jgi:membrane protease YdiL (CAAX protease family)
MTDLNKQSQLLDPPLIKFWHRFPIVIRATLSGIFVFMIGGTFAATAIFGLIPMPWSLFVMVGMLWVYWKYFNGSWWPQHTSQLRREYFRSSTKPAAGVLQWGLIAAALMVISFQSMLVVTFRIIEFPAEAFAVGIDLSSYPIWQVWFFLIMAAALAGITEEVGFRGYMQVPLEKRYSPLLAIIFVTVLFVLVHINQTRTPISYFLMFIGGLQLGVLAYSSKSLIPPIIAHTVADIISFAYWKTDVIGTFDYRPITETGVDAHFILWVLIFVISLALFIGAAYKTSTASNHSK